MHATQEDSHRGKGLGTRLSDILAKAPGFMLATHMSSTKVAYLRKGEKIIVYVEGLLAGPGGRTGTCQH